MALSINKRIQNLVASSTLTITARAKELKAQGQDVVNFAAGEPDFDTPEPIKQAAIRAIHEGLTKYTPSIGTPALREAIADKFKKDNHINYTPAQIVVSCGAKHSLYNIIQVLADDGDEVLIPSPYWVSYPEMVKCAGATPVFIPTTADTDFKITPTHLRGALSPKTRVMILNSPSNPTGALYTRTELEALAEIIVERDLYVISDEIYEKLIYDSDEYTSLASLGKEIYDRTITVNGVSKTYAMTGWRIGYCAGAAEVMGYIKKLQDHSTSNPSSISQMAALAALQAPVEVVVDMQKEFKQRRDLLMKGIDSIPQLSYIRPAGAFYLFCDVSRLGDSFAFAQDILNEKYVAMIPGEGFGAPGFVRMSFATSQAKIQEGVKRIAQWIQEAHR